MIRMTSPSDGPAADLRRPAMAVTALLVALALSLAGCGNKDSASSNTGGSGGPANSSQNAAADGAGGANADAQTVASQFLTAWGSEDPTQAAELTTDPQAASTTLQQNLDSLNATLEVTIGAFEPGQGEQADTATQRYKATFHLTDLGDWTYNATVPLTHTDQGWKVKWTPSLIHPKLSADTVLSRGPGAAVAAQVLDRHDKQLMGPVDVVAISLQPNKLTNPTTAYSILEKLGRDPKKAQDQVKKGPANAVFPQITVRKKQFEPYATDAAAAGLIITAGTKTLAPSPGFGRAVLAAALGASQVSKAGGGGSVVLAPMDKAGSGAANDVSAGTTLHEFPSTKTTTVATTLDLKTQQAAEKALDTVKNHAAGLVAIDTATGQVLAAANRDDSGQSTAFNRAFLGQYPPGSTFKIVSSSAFLDDGLKITDPVPCPESITVGSRKFQNFEGEKLGTVPFRTDFAQSCNTAMIGEAIKRLTNNSLHEKAPAFGLQTPWQMGVSAYSGSVPVTTSQTELAMTAIGQGRVLVSPLAMTNVAATVASGTWHAPSLIRSVSQDGGSPQTNEATPAPKELPAAKDLQELMYAGVTAGTGKPSLGSMVGKRKSGQIGTKTGTAEFGTGEKLPTHAWMVGFIDNLAFGVVLENGGVGGRDAGPVIRSFLKALGK